MSKLDFSQKYKLKDTNDEIDNLGKSINTMSDKLETTIKQLRNTNVELEKDIEEKSKIDEMRKQFISDVSHELKTPIALVMGYAEGLKVEINESPESRDFYCDVILDEAQKMDVLVKKLLTLNQLECGNDVISMERFDIVEMIKNYIQSAEIIIQQKQAHIIFEEQGPVYVWGDEFKVEEVVMNYFTNALNHLEGENNIIISLESMDGITKVKMFNTGQTIPEEALPHLWDKFYKVDKARTREYGGSGVGLSIVKAIMDSMNQHYGVCNHENGVEFWFEVDMT